MPRTQELWVLAAGPLANFIMAALLLQLHRQASYALYFLAAVSLCTGVYNLMPFGVLDGARLLQRICCLRKSRMRCAVPSGCCCACSARRRSAALLGGMPRGSACGGFPEAGYLLAKEFRQNKEERPAQRVNTVHRPFLFHSARKYGIMIPKLPLARPGVCGHTPCAGAQSFENIEPCKTAADAVL